MHRKAWWNGRAPEASSAMIADQQEPIELRSLTCGLDANWSPFPYRPEPDPHPRKGFPPPLDTRLPRTSGTLGAMAPQNGVDRLTQGRAPWPIPR